MSERAIDKNNVQQIVETVLQTIAWNEHDKENLKQNARQDLLAIPVGVSNRHVHLCRKDMDKLFGEGSELTKYRDLSQKGFFAAQETVTLAGPKGAISKVRLLGPLRKDTQIELLASDRFILGSMKYYPISPTVNLDFQNDHMLQFVYIWAFSNRTAQSMQPVLNQYSSEFY